MWFRGFVVSWFLVSRFLVSWVEFRDCVQVRGSSEFAGQVQPRGTPRRAGREYSGRARAEIKHCDVVRLFPYLSEMWK